VLSALPRHPLQNPWMMVSFMGLPLKRDRLPLAEMKSVSMWRQEIRFAMRQL